MTFLKTISMALIAGLMFCTPINPGSEVTNGRVTGRVVNGDGSAAPGAIVLLLPDTLNPQTINSNSSIDSAKTNDEGYYSFATISKGWYNLLASCSGKKSFQDSIFVNNDRKLQLEDITLSAPVSCSSVVRLENHEQDNRSVIVLVLGTNTYASPDDSSGKFILPELAAGTYRLRILTTLPEYEIKDTTLEIQTGASSAITNSIILKFLGIPKVGQLSVSYDDKMKFATISWPKLDTDNVIAYNIYRGSPDNSKPLNSKPISDTFFIDDVIYNIGDTVTYVVSALNHSLKEGGFSNGYSLWIMDGIAFVKSTQFWDPMTTNALVWSVVRDSLENVYVALGNTITKYNADGGLLKQYTDSRESAAHHILCVGKNGNVYSFIDFTNYIVRLTSDLSFASKIEIDSSMQSMCSNSQMTIDNDGDLCFWANCGFNQTDILKYSTTRLSFESRHSENFIFDLQWNQDTIIARQDPYSPPNASTLFYYDSTFSLIGTWNIGTDVERLRPDSENQHESKYYLGKNGWSVFFQAVIMGPFNESAGPKVVIFFDRNRKPLARSRLYGRIVDIDQAGNIHWFSGSTLYTIQIH
jgi:hypothetical protein